MSQDPDLDGIRETLRDPGASLEDFVEEAEPEAAEPQRPEATTGWRGRFNRSRLAKRAGFTMRADDAEMGAIEKELLKMKRLIEEVVQVIFKYSFVLVMSYDGGPGKSTTTAALALADAKHRRNDTVVVGDLNDHEGDADVKLGYEPRQGIDLPAYAARVVAGTMRLFGHMLEAVGLPLRLPVEDHHRVPVICSAEGEDVLTRTEFLTAALDLRRKANSMFWDCGTHGIKFRIHKLALGLLATQIVYVVLSNEEGYRQATGFRKNLLKEADAQSGGRYKYPEVVRRRMIYLAEHIVVVVNKHDNTDDQQEKWVRRIWAAFPKAQASDPPNVYSIPLEHGLANDVSIALSALSPKTIRQLLRLLWRVLQGSAKFFRDNPDLNLSDEAIYKLAKLPPQGVQERDVDEDFVEGEEQAPPAGEGAIDAGGLIADSVATAQPIIVAAVVPAGPATSGQAPNGDGPPGDDQTGQPGGAAQDDLSQLDEAAVQL